MGSGKTAAGIFRGLRFAQQPKVGLEAPRGLIGARFHPEIRDVVKPQLDKFLEGSGLLRQYHRQDSKYILTNGAEILLRPLEEPNRWRGIEVSWFFIDEARNVSRYAWEVLMGRLRQPGYQHAAWIASTPNGFDWLFDSFHPDSPKCIPGAKWYGASTYDNIDNVGKAYIQQMEAQYSGMFFEQEVLGKFVGVLGGAVFPEWDHRISATDTPYDPKLPLYAGWDFGVSDLGVVVFLQIDHVKKILPSGDEVTVPHLRFVDCIAENDRNAGEWAEMYKATCKVHFDGREPDAMFGDPAGKQRNNVTGTSMIQALAAKGVKIAPCRSYPIDHGINLLKNLMAGGRIQVDKEYCAQLNRAFLSHKWTIDEATGLRLGTKPVHDWASHYVDACRYLVSSIVNFRDFRRVPKPKDKKPPPGTLGHLLAELDGPPNDGWLRHF